jgi:hypothetical protein
MRAKRLFDETVERCGTLLEGPANYQGRQDCIRMAIVLAVAGLERYVKQRFLENLSRQIREQPEGNEALNKLLSESGVTADVWKGLALGGQSHPLKTVRSKVVVHLENIAIQNSSSINDLYKCYGLGSIVGNAARKTGLKTIWPSVMRIVNRRHKIAHDADYKRAGALESVIENDVRKRLGDLCRFVNAMDEIVSRRFAPKKRKVATTQKHIRQSRKTK